MPVSDRELMGNGPDVGAAPAPAATQEHATQPTWEEDDSEWGDGPVRGYDLAHQAELPPADYAQSIRQTRRSPASGRVPSSFEPNPRDPRQADKPRQRSTVEPVGRGGIFPLPKRPESTWLGSLHYPLWDGLGLACMFVVPPPMTIVSLLALGVLPFALKGGVMMVLAPITLGFVAIFILMLGYLLATMGAILIASARGEVHHPRWPDLDFGVIMSALLRWGIAVGLSCGLMVWPAMRYASGRIEIGLLDQLVIGGIISAGGVLGLLILLSIYLHDDAFALDPRLIFSALITLGTHFVGPLILLEASVALGVLAVAGIYRSVAFGFVPVLVATCLAWIFILYAGMVVMRATGRAYQRMAKAIGWFELEYRRVEAPIESTPSMPPPEI